ncbi:MAG: hypothetical protein KJI70_00615 [Patescibacteria group bacterium]|nr:hypothetical protein [Patescibacteria group bacterium]
MTKLVKNKLGNFLLTCLIFLLTISWLFSGQPRIWQNPPFPPEVQKAQAAITVESTTTSFDKKSLSSTITSVDATAGTAIYVFISAMQKSTGKFASSVVWDAATANEPLSLVGEAQNGKATVHIYKKISPTQKSATVTITWDDNNSNWNGSVHTAVVFSSIDTTTPDDGWNSNFGSGLAANIPIPTTSGDLVYDVVSAANSTTLTESGDGAQQWNDSTNNCDGAGSSVTANDAQSDMAWTLGLGVDWIEAGVSLNPVPTPTFTQNDSRWYWNADSVQPAGAMANENTTSTNATSSAVYRIRMNITIGTVDLTTSTQAFKLQYGTSTTGCPAVASWSDVGGLASGVIWRGYDNTGTDEEATTTSTLLSSSNVRESYEEANPSVANLLAIANGQDGEWDWVVQNNNAPGSTTYCFRMIKSNSTLLDGYNADGYPAIVTEAPSLTCNFSTTTASFGTLTSSAVLTAYGSTTIDITSGGTVFVKVQDDGDTGNPGLYKSSATTDLIGSADSASGNTASLIAGIEGYGLQATSTDYGSGAVMTIAARYDNASTTNDVGGFEITDVTMASSTAAVTNRRIILYYKAASSVSNVVGSYADVITYTCSVSE